MHRAVQHTRSVGHAKGFRITHRLHTKAAADIGVGHTDLITGQPKVVHQIFFGSPNALSIHSNMQPPICKFSETAAWLHRVADDPVVGHINTDNMCRRVNCGLHSIQITQSPIKRMVHWGLWMDRLSTNCQININRQIIGIEVDHLCRITRVVHCISDNHHNGFADVTHIGLG